jgi:glycosyltransferase involved in cell wall biosynthesis
LIGEGPDYLAMQKYAGGLGLRHPQVEFKGLIENAELVKLYQSASFLVQSSHYETFGTVVIEALACGLPVVSTNTGIAAGILGKENGIIIEHPSVGEIVKGIEKMLDIYSTFDGNKLHEMVAVEFSGSKISEKLTVIYNEILNTWQKG